MSTSPMPTTSPTMIPASAMATRKEKLEVADSEDEPLSSSPVDHAGEDADKLSPTANVPHQAIQDAPPQAMQCHQAFAVHTAKRDADRINDVSEDPGSAIFDVNSPSHHVTGLKPSMTMSEESTTAEDKDTDAQRPTTQQTMYTMQEGLDISGSTTENARTSAKTEREHDFLLKTTCEPLPSPDASGFNTQSNEMQPAKEQRVNEDCYLRPHSVQQTVSGASLDSSSRNALHDDNEDSTSLADVPRDEVVQRASAESNDQALEIPSGNVPLSEHEISHSQISLAADLPESIAAPVRATSNAAENEIELHTDLTAPTPLLHNREVQDAIVESRQDYENRHTSADRSTPTELRIHNDSQSSSISHPTVSELSSPIPVRPVPMKSAQEQTLAELRAQRTAILASLATLPTVQVLIEENALADANNEDTETQDQDEGPSEKDIMFAANKLVKEHIKLLHEYNELKDVGQGLMGLIADQRGVRIVEVQEEFGIDAKD